MAWLLLYAVENIMDDIKGCERVIKERIMKNLKLEDLSVEQKLGMVMCARSFSYTDETDVEFILNMIRNHGLGCVQVPYKKPELVKKILEAADYPIIMVLDMEMGYPASELPPIPMMTLAACDNPEYYRSFARAVVADAKAAGCNGTWGPVVDILSGQNPIMVYRKFSDDPERVAAAAIEISQVFANNHFMSCGKHYPGGSGIGMDSHMTTSDSPSTEEELLTEKLIPYKRLMEKGLLPAIMPTHRVHTAVDPEYPASLSKKVIDLIRNIGFDGVSFTDSFAMMAILQKYGEDKVLGMAIAAGNDIVLPNYRKSTKESFQFLMQNYRDGLFTEERLNEAVGRVLALQAYLGEEPENPDLFTSKDLENYYNIAKDCITAVLDTGLDAALDLNNKDRLFVVLTELDRGDSEIVREMITRRWYHPDEIIKKISQEFPEAEIVTLSEFSTSKENEQVLLAAARHKEVVFVTFCNGQPYLGTDGLTRRTEAVINSLVLSGKLSTVLHFGNPFALQTLFHIPRKLFGYMMPQSQSYAIEVLAGKIPAKGTLPYNVTFQ